MKIRTVGGDWREAINNLLDRLIPIVRGGISQGGTPRIEELSGLSKAFRAPSITHHYAAIVPVTL